MGLNEPAMHTRTNAVLMSKTEEGRSCVMLAENSILAIQKRARMPQ